MKKSAAAVAFSLPMLASATAFACPTGGPLQTAAVVGLFTAAFWVPLALVTSVVLFFLRGRFNSRRGLVLSMLGSLPFSAASVVGMLFVASQLLQPALREDSLIIASVVGCVTALNAGYVAFCHHVGRKNA